MQLIYARLAGSLDMQLMCLSDNERTNIIMKFQEGVDACTEGFHDRLSLLVLFFALPKTILQLLFHVRMALVEKTATSLTNEVHANNRCYVVAQGDGLGVEPPCVYDRYRGALSDDVIRAALSATFEHDYRAFHLPFLIEEAFKSAVMQCGYVGKVEKGYDNNVYLKIANYIQSLGLHKDQFELSEIFLQSGIASTTEEGEEEKEEKEEYSAFALVDLNWPLLRLLFHTALHNHQVLAAYPTPLMHAITLQRHV